MFRARPVVGRQGFPGFLLGCLVLAAGMAPAAQPQASSPGPGGKNTSPSPPAGLSQLRVLPEKLDGLAPQQIVHAWWMTQVRTACDRHDAEYEKLKTPEQLAAYQQRMKQFFLEQLGQLPERTPLEPRVVGRIDRGDFRIEKIIFQSQPRHYVTAALYLPKGKPPFPGVLFPCGHSANGKAGETYQRGPSLMAQNGLAVLCYDPLDQGERYQLLDEHAKPRVANTMAHCLTGVGAILLGRNTATYRVWDGMRAMDYLAGRPEVDAKRLGCTGNSGGGTLTSYLMALDDRIACAAPSCYLTSLRRLMETAGPQDAEQNIYGQIAYGLGHLEYILIRAPKPTLMCTATHDFFDITGSWDTFRQAKRFYARLGFAERVDLMENDDKHGYAMPLRVAATRWMRRWLLGIDDAVTEPAFSILSDAQLQCTPNGQAMLLEGARNVYDLNREYDEQLAPRRRELWRTAGRDNALAAGRERALAEVRGITGIRRLAELPPLQCEKTGSLTGQGYRIDKLILRPEPGVVLPALAFVPDKRQGPACLYVNAAGKAAEIGPDDRPTGKLAELLAAGRLVLAVDLLGLGETQPAAKTEYAKYLGPEWPDAFLAYMLGTSYLARRAENILVCGRFLQSYESPGATQEIDLVSLGLAGPPALHAVALQPELFHALTLSGATLSWARVVRSPLARNEFVNIVHGALRAYDLEDLLHAIPDRTAVKVIEPHETSP